MSKCLVDIKYDIIDKAKKDALNYGGFKEIIDQRDTLEITDARQAAESARKINNSFKEDVITPSVVSKTHYFIDPSDKLTQQYLDHYEQSLVNEAKDLNNDEKNRGGYTEDQRGEFFQDQDLPASKASPQTISAIKEFLNKVGVDIKTLQSIVVNGEKQDANGAALIMQKLVQVVEGKEAEALPEEAMHFAVAIIKQTNPVLYKQLLSEINGYAILNEVFKTYGGDKSYQTKEGKPDVVKLKEEAIGKVLAETIIKNTEGKTERPENLAKVENWWQKIVNAIKNLFVKSGMDQAALKVMSGEAIGTAEDIREAENNVYLQRTSQDEIYKKLTDVANKIEKRDDGYYIDGKKVPKRVTELVKASNFDLFKANELNKSEYKALIDEDKATNGTKGHADIEHALSLFVDKDGNLRDVALDDNQYISQLNPNNRDFYETLRDNLEQRLNTFPKGTKFMSEVTIYDAKRGVAGTVDFLAITPDGKVNILDWKFIDIDVKQNKDLPWYYVNSWRKQMTQYKNILETNYGVKAKDFDQTRMIPIRAEYTPMNLTTKEIPKLIGIEIGDVNVENINKEYLVPLGLKEETTGNEKIDALLAKLNAEHKRLSEKGVSPSERLSKNDQLNILFKSIRQLQMRGDLGPLLTQAKVVNRQLENIIQKYEYKFKGKDPKSFSEKELNEMSSDINNAQKTISIYTNLYTELKFLFTGDLSEEEKQLRSDLRDSTDNARELQAQLQKVSDEFASETLANSVDIDNLLSPEKIIKGVGKWFGTTSTFQTKAIQTLFKKANKAFAFAGFDTISETRKLQKLQEAYETMANAKGLSPKDYFNLIKKKDSNELIDQYNPEFYSVLKQKINDKDITWIKDNIDIDAYKKFLDEKINEETERIEAKMANRVGTNIENLQAESDEISQMKSRYNISNKTGTGWLQYNLINKFPKQSWESTQWNELKNNKAAKDFYDYIREKNEEYADLGYINKREARTFLPFMRKGLMEKIIFGGKISLGEQFLRSISIDEEDVGFGTFDPITGQPIDKIPKYFTKEIDGELSTDLFRNMSLYNEMAIKYKYVSEIEEQVQVLINTEKNKKAIATSVFGKTQYKDKDGELVYTPDNSENTKLLEDMTKSIIYGQKYLTSESFDQLLTKFGDFGGKINEKIGYKIFPENLEGRQVSFNKLIQAINHNYQVKALGLNFLSSASNYFGGNAQSWINSGKYFTKSEYFGKQSWLLTGKMIGGDKVKAIAALEYFLPLTENFNAEISKTLSVGKLSQEKIQDFLMVLMRHSDKAVQVCNFYSFLDNSIVQDGKVVNAREYLRTTDEYKDMFAGTREERAARKEAFEKDVKKIIADKGVMKLSSVVNGELVIPGIERKSESVVELRRKVQSLTKDALGSLSADDIRPINQTIYGTSFMMFKNWVPRLVDVRIGNLKYNSASDAYEWGRMRMLYRVVTDDLKGSLSSLMSAIGGNDEKWVAQMRTLYDKKSADYKADTGKDLEMTESEFMNMANQNIKAALADATFSIAMFALVIGLKAGAPGKEEDKRVINEYKFLMRMTDKFNDELTYFYNPASFSSLLSNGIFPAMSTITNFETLITKFGKEMFYLYTGDEVNLKKNFVLKYAMKQFPVTSQVGAYLPIFYPEAAKDLGIKAQSQSGFIR